MTRTCLKSPEVYDWLLNFAGVMINIGYLIGVKIVYTTHLNDLDPTDFKDFSKRDVDAGEQIWANEFGQKNGGKAQVRANEFQIHRISFC